MAFKHVLIRDVAYGMLPKAVRSRSTSRWVPSSRTGGRPLGRAGRAAGRALRPRRVARPRERRPVAGARGHARARLRFLEEAGDAAALLYANREAAEHYRRARDLPAGRSSRRGAHRREARRRLAAAGSRGRGDRRLVRLPRVAPRREDLLVADLHRKIGAALSHKGERKAAIEHYQKGINLLKDGPPRIELVRLYEEAAWLYLHTGDNMLAIYASEKALRLAERLDETRAASRAHGIFGVFGRIGDTEKARQNLERAVELARGSTTARRSSRCPRSGASSRSPRPTWRRPGRVRRGARARSAGGHAARAGGAARLARPAGRLRRGLGTRGELHRGERNARGAREGLVGKL